MEQVARHPGLLVTNIVRATYRSAGNMKSPGDRRKRSRANLSVAAEEETARRVASSKRLSAGGIYVLPHRVAAAAANHDHDDDMLGGGYQRRSWDALRKSITGLVNKATPVNIRHVARELLSENLVRGRGLLCRALMRSQAACPAFTDVFAALAAVVNSKLPSVGRLLLVRLVLRLRRAHAGGDRHQLAAAARFVAHLVNQGVAHDLLALELLALLLDKATEDNVEVAAAFVKECGSTLRESCPRGLDAVFDTLRGILHDGNVVDRRVQFIIEHLLALRRAQFHGHPPMRPELDLVEPEDQKTHKIELYLDEADCDHQMDPEYHLDVFEPSPSLARDEAVYDSTLHRVETDELRASAKFFAQLLAVDALPWRGVLGCVRMTEGDTTSSSRIFIKVLFQDLSDQLGISLLSRKMNDDDTDVRNALFPIDCAENTRFAIDFFTAIGLGGVTNHARKLLLAGYTMADGTACEPSSGPRQSSSVCTC
jgi:hypothetical protein